MFVPCRLDEDSLRRVFPRDDLLRGRIEELTAALAPHTGAGAPFHPDESALRAELALTHLARGSDVRAAGISAVAELRAGLLPARRTIDRLARKHAVHLARLTNALCWQWQGRYVHSTMLYLELLAALDPLDRETQAVTQWCSATNDADQALWADAADHFEQAILMAGTTPVLPELLDAARTGYAAARRHVRGEAA